MSTRQDDIYKLQNYQSQLSRPLTKRQAAAYKGHINRVTKAILSGPRRIGAMKGEAKKNRFIDVRGLNDDERMDVLLLMRESTNRVRIIYEEDGQYMSTRSELTSDLTGDRLQDMIGYDELETSGLDDFMPPVHMHSGTMAYMVWDDPT